MSVDLNELAQAIEGSNPALDHEERRIASAVYHLLALGRPVTDADVAERVGIDATRVRRTLDGWSGVFRDEQERLVGFWGLAIHEMPHVLEFGGRKLYTWCAWDPLFIAPLLGEVVRVRSRCPVTGLEVSLTVTADGVRGVDPSSAVLSFLRPSDAWGDDVMERFCHHILLFASEEAATSWAAERPEIFLMSVDEGFELGRRTFGHLFETGTRL